MAAVVVTIAIKIIKEGSAILRDDIRPELGVVHIISDGSEEVNEFLEEGVKSGANALMTTLSFFSRPVFSRKVNLMMILAPSFPTVHYIMTPQEREFFFNGYSEVTIKIVRPDNSIFHPNMRREN